MQLEHLDVYSLKITFNVVFRHASAERDSTASLWLEARDAAGRTGLGESCPRAYVTGENLAGAAAFIGLQLDGVKAAVHDIESLRAWVSGHAQDIDRNPAAWCALELALLDLLAREQGQPVEALLGLPLLRGPFRYTAVLGDADVDVFSKQRERYRQAGFSQFKVKLSGRYEHDRDRLALFSGECAEGCRVRLDANNLWQDWRVAADYLQRLPGSFAGIEEPLAAGDLAGMMRLFRETGIPVILDESLLRVGQVAGLAEGIGWRINLRVSKLGGLLRSLDVLEAARDRDIPVIVGAQVGETSLLTRAALTLAAAAGDLLAGQEGAFGTHLLSREICRPVLMFGAGGRLGGELVEELAGMPGYGLVRAGDTDALLSKEP
jgi:L-alanine-DL-glutamate epimerase-like enolase superfamily enzyme